MLSSIIKGILDFFHKFKFGMLSSLTLRCRWLRDHTFQNSALYYRKSIQINKVLLYKLSLCES